MKQKIEQILAAYGLKKLPRAGWIQSGIDPLAVIDIQQIIYQLTKKGIGVLISDHNVRETLGVCDDAYIMSQGKVIESGNPDKIISSEIAKKIYLGKNFKL